MGQILIEQVTKRFGSATALDHVSLAVPEGQTTVLVGPSGCGKSTLLNMILGVLIPDEGQILVRGQRLDPSGAVAFRQSIGTVLQDGGLFPHMTARQNILLMTDVMGGDRAQADRRVTDLADLAHLPTELLDRYPAQLSGGQRQRVALMRALMHDPDILLMDEPFGALDTLVRHALQDDLKQLFAQLKKTVVMVTHDMAEAAFFADTVVLLNAGKIVQSGPPKDLVSAPTDPFVTEFLTARRDLMPLMTGTDA